MNALTGIVKPTRLLKTPAMYFIAGLLMFPSVLCSQQNTIHVKKNEEVQTSLALIPAPINGAHVNVNGNISIGFTYFDSGNQPELRMNMSVQLSDPESFIYIFNPGGHRDRLLENVFSKGGGTIHYLSTTTPDYINPFFLTTSNSLHLKSEFSTGMRVFHGNLRLDMLIDKPAIGRDRKIELALYFFFGKMGRIDGAFQTLQLVLLLPEDIMPQQPVTIISQPPPSTEVIVTQPPPSQINCQQFINGRSFEVNNLAYDLQAENIPEKITALSGRVRELASVLNSIQPDEARSELQRLEANENNMQVKLNRFRREFQNIRTELAYQRSNHQCNTLELENTIDTKLSMLTMEQQRLQVVFDQLGALIEGFDPDKSKIEADLVSQFVPRIKNNIIELVLLRSEIYQSRSRFDSRKLSRFYFSFHKNKFLEMLDNHQSHLAVIRQAMKETEAEARERIKGSATSGTASLGKDMRESVTEFYDLNSEIDDTMAAYRLELENFPAKPFPILLIIMIVVILPAVILVLLPFLRKLKKEIFVNKYVSARKIDESHQNTTNNRIKV